MLSIRTHPPVVYGDTCTMRVKSVPRRLFVGASRRSTSSAWRRTASGNVEIKLRFNSEELVDRPIPIGTVTPLRFVHDSEVCQRFIPQDNQRTYFRRGSSKDPKKHLWQRYPCLKRLPKVEVKEERSSSPPLSSGNLNVGADGQFKVAPAVASEVDAAVAEEDLDIAHGSAGAAAASDPSPSVAPPNLVVTSALGFWRERDRSMVREIRQHQARLQLGRTSILFPRLPQQLQDPPRHPQQQQYHVATGSAQKLSCEFCEEPFRCRDALRQHLKAVHQLSTCLRP